MSFREDCGLTQPGNTSRNRAIRSALGVLRFQLFTISLQIYYCTSGSLVMLLQIFGSPDIRLVNNNERYRRPTCGMYVPHMWYVPHRIHAFVDQYVRDAVRTMQTGNARTSLSVYPYPDRQQYRGNGYRGVGGDLCNPDSIGANRANRSGHVLDITGINNFIASGTATRMKEICSLVEC